MISRLFELFLVVADSLRVPFAKFFFERLVAYHLLLSFRFLTRLPLGLLIEAGSQKVTVVRPPVVEQSLKELESI